MLVVNFQHNRPLRHAWTLIANLRDSGFVPIARKPPAVYTFVEESSVEMLHHREVRPS